MNGFDMLKKGRTYTSFDTSCSIDENMDQNFKIKVASPKKAKVWSQQNASGSIMEATIEEEMKESMLTKSHQKMGSVNTQLRQSSRSQQNRFNKLRGSGNQLNKRETVIQADIESQSQNQSIVGIESSCMISSNQSQCSSKNSRVYIENIMTAQQELRFSPITLNITDRCRDSEKSQGTSNLITSKTPDLVIKLSQPEQKQEKGHVKFDIDNDQIISIHDTGNSRKTIEDSRKKKINATLLKPKERESEKINALKLDQVRSAGRMKLRDYLFMAHSSRTKKNSQKHELLLTRKASPRPTALPKIDSSNSLLRNSSKNTKDNKSDFQSKPSKLRSTTSRYSISNFQMCQVLKSQISSQIVSIKEGLQSIENELNNVDMNSEDYSTEEMLLLYNIRREIKDHVAKNVKSMIELIRQKKKNVREPTTKMEEDEVIQSMTCSTFLKRHA